MVAYVQVSCVAHEDLAGEPMLRLLAILTIAIITTTITVLLLLFSFRNALIARLLLPIIIFVLILIIPFIQFSVLERTSSCRILLHQLALFFREVQPILVSKGDDGVTIRGSNQV